MGITAGIDCGAKHTKTVLMKDGKILGKGMGITGFDLKKAAEKSLEAALNAACIRREEVGQIAGTGSGVDMLSIADLKVDPREAMAGAARYAFPDVRTVIDVGAEEGRAARLDESGSPVDLVVNERCAAGAGIFIETIARILDVSMEETGRLFFESGKKIPLNAQCVIFAESEVVGLIHANTPKSDIIRAVFDAMAGRIASMIRRIGVLPEVMMIGGVAYNPGLVQALKHELKTETIRIPDAPEFGAAVGAAVFAAQKRASA